MNLVTYNLRSGGTGRAHWVKILEDFRPGLFFVQETVAPEDHLPLPVHADAVGGVTWASVEGRRWGSAVYSGVGEARSIELPDFHGHVVGLDISGAEWPDGSHSPIRAFSVHSPARGSYQKAVNQILDMIARHSGVGDLVIGGDFNLTIGARRDGEARKTRAADLAIQGRLRDEFGLVNCWLDANPDLPLAQTLRWSNAPEIPYHCDGLFVPRSWSSRLRSCEVVSSTDWDRLGDHNPVVARFGIRGETTDD
jgi:hypothetical protein